MPSLSLDPTQGSLIQQVMHAIRQAIAGRQLAPGQRLPSVRQLATTLGISTFTVADSYSRLVQQGVILARRGDGYYVARTPLAPPMASMLLPTEYPMGHQWVCPN